MLNDFYDKLATKMGFTPKVAQIDAAMRQTTVAIGKLPNGDFPAYGNLMAQAMAEPKRKADQADDDQETEMFYTSRGLCDICFAPFDVCTCFDHFDKK